jgi:hypothetical protein
MRHSPIKIDNTIKTRTMESRLQPEKPPKGSTPIVRSLFNFSIANVISF